MLYRTVYYYILLVKIAKLGVVVGRTKFCVKSCRALSSVVECYRVLSSVVECYRVLSSALERYRVLSSQIAKIDGNSFRQQQDNGYLLFRNNKCHI
jgi:hypothetical protein